MDTEGIHDFENEGQYWQHFDESVSRQSSNHSDIDDALRTYLTLVTGFPEYVQSENDIRRCAYKLHSSALFASHPDYVRHQFVYCLIQEDDPRILQIATTFLLYDARENESTFELLNAESAFSRLVDLITAPKQDEEEGLHRLLMELMYEMARLQRITNEDLTHIGDDFILCLFNIIEEVSDDVSDPYHYPVIRVLLVLNEQFMVAAHDPAVLATKTVPLTNKVMKVLSAHGSRYKTFGENIILLLNREDETSLQLLTLKLLYLIFTTPPTYEYFYTNDLHVLLDILVRNLLDLPEEASALRHTYLRVLYPLLEHTQLKEPPHYKQDEIRKLLTILAGGCTEDGMPLSHFEAVDETTRRLVNRCQAVSWLHQIDVEERADSPTESIRTSASTSTLSPAKGAPPALPAPRKLRKRTNPGPLAETFLTPNIDAARQSSLSMVEMATQKERPGVKTPSRNPSFKHGLRDVVHKKEKEKPPPPRTRRSGWLRTREKDHDEADQAMTGLATEVILSPPTDDAPPSATLQSAPDEGGDLKAQKPPPPKTRRWGRRRADASGVQVVPNDLDPQPDLPPSTSHTPSIDDRGGFSPAEERTLVPAIEVDKDKGRESNNSKRMSSVGAALLEAQAQATKEVQETFENAQIREEPAEETTYQAIHDQPVDSYSGKSQLDAESTARLARIVLTPPSQAPIRGVPGPKVELGRSPFLSEENEEDDEVEFVDAKATAATETEPEPEPGPVQGLGITPGPVGGEGTDNRKEDRSESEWDEWD